MYLRFPRDDAEYLGFHVCCFLLPLTKTHAELNGREGNERKDLKIFRSPSLGQRHIIRNVLPVSRRERSHITEASNTLKYGHGPL